MPKLKMTMIIDLSFILFNISQPSDYSISLLLLARSSIPTSIREGSSSVSLGSNLNCMHLMQNCRKNYYLHRDYLIKKTDSVLASENAPIKSSKTAKCPHSHSHRSGPCLFAGSLRVSFLRWSTSHKQPKIQEYTRSCQRFKQPNSLLACLS